MTPGFDRSDPISTAAEQYSRVLLRELQSVADDEFVAPSRPEPTGNAETDATVRSDYEMAVDALYRRHHQRQEAALRAVRNLAESPTDWPTIYAAEADLIHILDDSRLRRRAWFIRDRFTEVAGSEKAARYLASGAPDIKSATADDLRADLLELHREMTYRLTFRRQAERERARLLGNVSYLTLAIVLVFTAFAAGDAFLGFGQVILGLVAAAAVATVVIGWYRRRRARNAAQKPPNQAPPPPAPPPPAPPPTLSVSSTTAAAGVFLIVFGLTTWAVDVNAETTQTTQTTQTTTASKPDEGQKKTEEASPAVDEKTKKSYEEAAKKAALDDLAPNNTPTLAFAALAGLLGAAFSLLQRAQSSEASDPQVALFSFSQAGFPTFLISMLCGLISAIAIYAVFAGGMLTGALFPNITNGQAALKGFAFSTDRFLKMTGPASVADHAKLLVWAFIGGFSERVVPDILDRFVSSAKK